MVSARRNGAGEAVVRKRAQGFEQPVRVPKTAEVIADQIRRRIIYGQLQEGDFLPPEAQLMATLNISRPTLREAFRILEAESLVSVVRGSRTGARVHRPKVESVSRYAGFVLQANATTVADVYEARLAIEPFLARRLAERRPPGAVDRLREAIASLKALVEAERYVEFMTELAEFHRLLVELGGNQTLLFITEMLQEVVARHQVEFFERRNLPPDVQRKRGLAGLRSFEKLVELIEAGEGERAEAHWRLHVLNSNAAWVPPDDSDQMIRMVG